MSPGASSTASSRPDRRPTHRRSPPLAPSKPARPAKPALVGACGPARRTIASMSTLLLIDGLSLAYRAFYALPSDLATAAGTITNAVYGFTSMLVKVLGDEQPDGIAVVFDAPGPTFRNDLDADYKGNRKETPDIFIPQIPLIHEVIDTLRIPALQIGGVE